MKRILIVMLGAALLVGCGGNTMKEAAQPTTKVTSAAPTVAPVEPTAIPVMPTAVPAEPTAPPEPEGIVPCTDGTQESCAVWRAIMASFSHQYPDADIAWLDCAGVYVSNNYTKEQVMTFTDPDIAYQVGAEVSEACGLP